MFLALASLFMFACNNDDELSPAVDNSIPDGQVIFDVSAVNSLNAVNTRAGLYSQEATQKVTNVKIHAFASDNNGDYFFVRTYSIPNWSLGTTSKSYQVGDSEKLPMGDYIFLAVGRDAVDKFKMTEPTSSTSYKQFYANIDNSGDETEIFVGGVFSKIASKGVRVEIPMVRGVAGVLGYFKNVPAKINDVPVKYLRLTATNASQSFSFATGTGSTTAPAAYNIINMDISGQAVNNGLYAGNSIPDVIQLPGSQLDGSYFMPVTGVKLTLGLYDASNNPLKTWVVKDASNGNSDTFDIKLNQFYSLGTKNKVDSTNGGTSGDPTDDDNAIDLLFDQNILITINPNWSMLHNLTIE